MPDNPKVEKHEAPARPFEVPKSIEEAVGHLYIMYYREGLQPNCTKIFFNAGDLAAARLAANDYCFKMPNHRLAFVKPFLTNLQEDIRRFGIAPAPQPIVEVLGGRS